MRVLIAEDSATSRLLLQHTVDMCGYRTVEVTNGLEAWEVLKGADPPRLVILDWVMPELDGPSICRLVREHGGDEPPYIILVTARDKKHDIVAGLTAGADDFVIKPFDADELRARLEVGRRFVELNRKLAETQRLLEVQATTDTLTGVANRRAVISRLEEELERADRDGASLSVGMVDIDHFKRVNDTHGHPAGDAVLREVARCVATSLRPYDTLGRVGGEEFLIVMPATMRTEALGVLERVRNAVEDLPVIIDGRPLAITVSLGGATWEGEAVDRLIGRADDALYEAKTQGRNRVLMACAELDETVLTGLQQAV